MSEVTRWIIVARGRRNKFFEHEGNGGNIVAFFNYDITKARLYKSEADALWRVATFPEDLGRQLEVLEVHLNDNTE